MGRPSQLNRCLISPQQIRTTLQLDDDVLAAARVLASQKTWQAIAKTEQGPYYALNG